MQSRSVHARLAAAKGRPDEGQMKEDNIKFIRLQFVDINGSVKNIVIPFKESDMEDLFVEGMLFDGSSIEGFVGINESDFIKYF